MQTHSFDSRQMVYPHNLMNGVAALIKARNFGLGYLETFLVQADALARWTKFVPANN